MSWWKSLFKGTNQGPISLPRDEFPPELTQRARPPKRSKKLSKEEREADRLRYLDDLRRIATATSTFNRERAVALGAKKYRWSSAGDERVCDRCRRNHGRLFYFDKSPPGGHPGEEHHCPDGSCRCIAIPVVKF